MQRVKSKTPVWLSGIKQVDGLKLINPVKRTPGDNILIEARILGVADVVEAMVSPRSHREAPGLEKALEELTNNRGKRYDPAVVDACLKLFTEKGFAI